MTKRFALVCCGKKKQSAPALAKDLYVSTLFKKTRAYVEVRYDGWFVLSALHRVVDPDQLLAPYDVTLEKAESNAWSRLTAEQLIEVIPPGSVVAYFGGALYARVVPYLQDAGYTVDCPLQGLQIGQRLRWLTQRENADD